MLAASMEPGAEPAPIMVCISSINRIMSGFFFSSIIMERSLSSNCPRYFVPATTAAISSERIRLPNSIRDTLRCTIRCERPSTMADLPTPGSPIRIGLFFLRRVSICARRSISFSRPTTGSSFPSCAACVISVLKLSRTGVLLPDFAAVAVLDVLDFPESDCGSEDDSSSSSSSSLSVRPIPIWTPFPDSLS